MIQYQQAILYHCACIVLFGTVYFVYTTAFSDDFGLYDDDRFMTAQNSLYLAMASAVGVGRPVTKLTGRREPTFASRR